MIVYFGSFITALRQNLSLHAAEAVVECKEKHCQPWDLQPMHNRNAAQRSIVLDKGTVSDGQQNVGH